MDYDYLSPELYETADAVHDYLINELGLRNINIEKQIHPKIKYGPTFNAKTSRGYIICVEVAGTPYPGILDSFILDCIRRSLPIKLFVANPDHEFSREESRQEGRQADNGVGYLIFRDGDIIKLRDALELSLLIPDIDMKKYPKKFRNAISDAKSTYQNGNPVKGVAEVCDEIEDLIRKTATKAKRKGKIPIHDNLDLNKGALAKLIKKLEEKKVLDHGVLTQCEIVKRIRNDSSHPPKDYNGRMKRHQKLKTNFQVSIDLLDELIVECKKKKLYK